MKRVRVLVPHRALEAGVRALAGEVLDIPAEVAEVLLRDEAGEEAPGAPIGPFVDPEPEGYAAWDWTELHREAAKRQIPGREAMRRPELIEALEASDRAGLLAPDEAPEARAAQDPP